MILSRSHLSPSLPTVAVLGLACGSARADVVEPLVTDAKLHGRAAGVKPAPAGAAP